LTAGATLLLAAAIIKVMTQLDVLYRYGAPPTESAILAMAKVREVYGVRRMEVDEANKTVRVEYDASRLTGAVIHELLRRAGIDIVETMPMFVTPPPLEPVAAT
jgi:copper chaperone CopZ